MSSISSPPAASGKSGSRDRITLLKMKKIMGHFDGKSSLDILQSDEVNAALRDYFELLETEEIPEKGERRASDDYVFVIEEILRDSVTDANDLALDGLKLFRIALLEFWLSKSVYNFDIALQLTKLYIDLNLHNHFSEKLSYLELKGVQLESLGYIPIKHLISHNDESSLSYWYQRYFKYLQNNSRDLKKLKWEAFSLNNYDKVDEFWEYEQYLESSYFTQLVKYLHNVAELKNKLTSDSSVSSILSTITSPTYEYLDEKFDDVSDEGLAKHFKRTQDLGVFISKFESASKYKFDDNQLHTSVYYTSAKDDPIFSCLKFSKYCNYKPGLTDSLSIFEHPIVFQVYKGLYHLTAQLNHKEVGDVEKIQEVLKSLDKKVTLTTPQGEFSQYIWWILKSWLSLWHLTTLAVSLKELKSDGDKLNEAIESNNDFINTHTDNIINTFSNNVFSEKPLEATEEVKLSHDDLKSTQEYFTKHFYHTNIGRRASTFFTNYLQGFNISLRQLSDALSALQPKKKKKDAADSGLSKLNQPWKEMFKVYKKWVTLQHEIYSSIDSHYEMFIDQITGHYSEYLK